MIYIFYIIFELEMKISKSTNNTIVDESINYDSIFDFLIGAIDCLIAIRIKECKPLTNRMKRFYASSIIHYNLGITNPISESALQIYKKYYKETVNKVEIADLLKIISKRNWIFYDKEEKSIEIHPLFKKIDLKNLSFSFNIILRKNENQPD